MDGILSNLLVVLVCSAVAMYVLWILYLAITNLARAKLNGRMTNTALILGVPIAILTIALDVVVNLLVMTFVFLELPKELTVSDRLRRHNKEPNGWRKAIAAWFEPLLDPYDTDGDHV